MIIITCSSILKTHAQLGFCPGNSGDTIFTENFGTGTSFSTLPPPGTTTYTYSAGYPLDGAYTVSNNTFGNPYDWHQIVDHTPVDSDGKALIVNAEANPGEFYRTVITGLCQNTTYEFSAWLINLVIANSFCAGQPGGSIPINVRFEISNGSDTVVLRTGDTGPIIETSTVKWNQFGLVFNTGNDTSVILKIINNGTGGCGNDLAIDDIEFKSCGDNATTEDAANNGSLTLCSGETPYALQLTTTPDGSVYNSYFYQWQESTDGTTWNNIISANSQTVAVSVTASGYYRAKIAEVASNLNNDQCISFSDEFQAMVTPSDPMPTLECWETATLNPSTCTWTVFGTQPIQPTIACYEVATFSDTTCSWEISGTMPNQPSLESWETAIFDSIMCTWSVSITPTNTTTELNVVLCEGNELVLQPNTSIDMPNYLWNTGAVTNKITIMVIGVYSVEITDGVQFSETIVYNVSSTAVPIIESVVSNGAQIEVTTANSGDFMYSLDGVVFQALPRFDGVEGGAYTIYVKSTICDTITSVDHLHLLVPQFFTPNNDGYHDYWNVLDDQKSIAYVYIIDRFGKILKKIIPESEGWNGTYQGNPMVEDDYWYVIVHDSGKQEKGHFSLIRR